MTEFKLSDKKECVAIFGNQFLVYPEKDVKEFIRELKKRKRNRYLDEKKVPRFDYVLVEDIDKLAGEELLK